MHAYFLTLGVELANDLNMCDDDDDVGCDNNNNGHVVTKSDSSFFSLDTLVFPIRNAHARGHRYQRE